MSIGTIKVTNKSDKVVGVGTAFTTDLKAGDVMVIPVGTGSFTLVVKSIESSTGLTLMEPFRGPTLSGQPWSAVPYETMLRINAQLSTQTGVAIYGLNLDKQNWQAVFSESGDITITLPDLTTFTGPSWKKIADLLESLNPTQVGRDIVGKSTIADILTYLGLGDLGTASRRNVGTGANQIPDMSSFASTLNMPGVARFPGGFKLMWALGNTNSNGAADVVFPTSFDVFGLGAIAIERNPYAWGAGISNTWAIQLSTLTKTGVQAICRVDNGSKISPVENAGCIVFAWGK